MESEKLFLEGKEVKSLAKKKKKKGGKKKKKKKR